MKQAFWKSPHVAKRYLQAWKVACTSVAGGPPATLTPESYDNIYMMCEFYRAFS
jgi:hypothetical protein